MVWPVNRHDVLDVREPRLRGFRQRRGGSVVACHPNPDRERVEVADVGQVARVDQRPVPRVARGEREPPPAGHVDQASQAGGQRLGEGKLPAAFA